MQYAKSTARALRRHPTESPREPRRSTTEDRERVPEGQSTPRTGWWAPLPPEQVAANLDRMAG